MLENTKGSTVLSNSSKFNSTQELIYDFKLGKMVILVDDEDRENEGDIIVAADFITAEAINFMSKNARGLICLALHPDQVARLQLPQMVSDEKNSSPNKTAFTVSIEAARGVTTGISAQDRAHTVKVACDPNSGPSDVQMPGHIFPIRANKDGVLARNGHTEAGVDLARLSGLNPAAVICEVMNDDGSMARVPDLFQFAQKFEIKIGMIKDLVDFRNSNRI
jgi:3,4-dihydroxy 2-butanone 4-phosphate synthase/GTP cyclohydrolase II